MRGTVVPVVSMAELFHLPFTCELYSPVILIRGHGGTLGFLVDEVESVMPVDAAGLRDLSPGHTANEYAEAEFTSEGRRIVLLDCDRLLLAEERLRIQELRTQLEARRQSIEAGRS
jgi:chemotaxis signal transduction protein